MALTLSQLMSSLGLAFGQSTSAYYFPTLILSQTLPADPLSVSAVDFGDLAVVSSSLPGELADVLGCGTAKSSPMTLSNLSVTGLANGVVAQPQVNGDTVTVTVTFGSATAPTGLTLSPPTVSGSFTTTPACTGSKPIQGTFNTQLTGCSATLTMTVDSTFAVSNCSIQFTAASTTTTYLVTSPRAQAFQLNQPLDNAFNNQPSANQAVAAAIQNAANAQSAELANLLTLFLQSAANQSVVSFLVSMLYKASTNASSQYYAPKLVEQASNPTLEPYQTDGSWPIGDINHLDPSAANLICGSAGSVQGESWIAIPAKASPITLSGTRIVGLSNVTPLAPLATNLPNGNVQVTGLAVFGQVPSWPHTFSLTGSFEIDPACCVTEDFQTCSAPADAGKGTGTFNVAIQSAGVAATFLVSADASNNLTATAQALWFVMDPDAVNPENITLTVDISSIPDDNERMQWNQQVEKALNTTQGCQNMLRSLQQEANQDGVLGQLTTFLTNALNNLSAAG